MKNGVLEDAVLLASDMQAQPRNRSWTHPMVCVWLGVCREATTLRAGARKEARQRQTHEQAYQRVCSGLTQKVNVIEGKKSSIHAEFLKVTSGQLRFL